MENGAKRNQALAEKVRAGAQPNQSVRSIGAILGGIEVKLALLIALTSVLVAGCVTVGSDVVPVGKDTYQMSMTGVGFATQANTNVKALKAANDYCNKMGKHMVPQHSAESGVYG